MACFTFSNLLSSRAYNFFHKAFSFTLLIRALKATDLIKFSTLSISSLNLFRYVLVDPSFTWVIPKSSMKLFFVGILVLKCVTSLAQRSLKLVTERGYRLLYHALTETLKVIRRILHMAWLS